MLYLCTQCRQQYQISDPARAAVTPCQACGGRLMPLQSPAGTPVSGVQAPYPPGAPVPGAQVPQQAAQPQAPQITFEKGEAFKQYEIMGKLGQGGMGVVYKGKDRNLQRLAALKILPPGFADQNEEARKRFVREARSAAKLIHQNVVTVFEAGEESGLCYIAMEFIAGPSVQALLKKQKRIEPKIAVKIIEDAAQGLEFAHNVELIHRDVKPDNILLHPSGMAKVADFGLAKSTEGDTANITGTGHIVGTPHYMSPEQCEGKEIDRRSDIYSLCVTLYHMLTGEPPFQAKSTMAILHKHVYDPVPDPRDVAPEIPERLAKVVMRGMAKEPEERFASAKALIDELQALDLDEEGSLLDETDTEDPDTEAGTGTMAIRLAAQELGAQGDVQYWESGEEEEGEEEEGSFAFYAVLAVAVLIIAGGAFIFRDPIRTLLSPNRTTTSSVSTTPTTTPTTVPFEVMSSGARVIDVGRPVMEVAHLGQTSSVVIRDARGQIRLWDYLTQEPGLPLPTKADLIAASPDGKKLALASGGGLQVYLYKAPKLKPLKPFTASEGSIRSMSFNPLASELIVAGERRQVTVFGADSGRPVKSPQEKHESEIIAVRFSPYRLRYVLGVYADGQVRLWSAIGKELKYAAQLKHDDVTAAALGFNPEHTTVAILAGQKVWCLDPKLGPEAQPQSVDLGGEKATCVGFSWRAQYLAIGTAGGNVWIVDWPGRKRQAHKPLHSQEVTSLTFAQGCGAEESGLLITGSRGSRVSVISVEDLLKAEP